MITSGEFPISESTGLPGYETIAEERQLITLARQVPDNGLIVELGGELGRSAGQFLHATRGKNVKVFTVDLYPTDHHVAGNLQDAQNANLVEALGEEALRHEQIKGNSWAVGQKWKQGKIDLLFIDAAHDYKAVQNDISAWVGHVKTGGVVAFHDYAIDKNSHYLHHEVKQSVDEWALKNTNWAKQGQVDSLVWFINFGELKDIPEEFKADDTPVNIPDIKGEWLEDQQDTKPAEVSTNVEKPKLNKPNPSKPGRKPKIQDK